MPAFVSYSVIIYCAGLSSDSLQHHFALLSDALQHVALYRPEHAGGVPAMALVSSAFPAAVTSKFGFFVLSFQDAYLYALVSAGADALQP